MVSMRSQRKKPPFLSNFLGDKIRKLKVSAVFRAQIAEKIRYLRGDAFVDDPLLSLEEMHLWMTP